MILQILTRCFEFLMLLILAICIVSFAFVVIELFNAYPWGMFFFIVGLIASIYWTNS